MSTTANCPRCGGTMPSDMPYGLCPRCLLNPGGLGPLGTYDPTAPGRPLANASRAGSLDGRGPTGHSSRFVPPDPAELQVHFPQLEILQVVGQGGMGAVYRARHRGLDREVALKILPPWASDDPQFAERFHREARALARLSHPHIVAVYDSGRIGPYYFLLMEYVDGVNLRQAMLDGQIEPKQALEMVSQICDALQYAHNEHVVHRDIKPENVLVDRRGRVKVVDFGLAKLVDPATPDYTLTGTNQVMGTPRYMAPEQLEGARDVDHRADIYSLGVVFYELLTGELPLGRFAPPSRKVQLDVRLDEVVLRTLEKQPSQRYQQANELKTDVELLRAERWVAVERGREYRSEASLFGWPLLHIAHGVDPRTGRRRVAKGIIAIGDTAIGVVALGGTAWGGLAMGGVATGVVACGGFAAGGVAFGGLALAFLALGGFALGLVAIGGMAIGVEPVGGLRVQVPRFEVVRPETATLDTAEVAPPLRPSEAPPRPPLQVANDTKKGQIRVGDAPAKMERADGLESVARPPVFAESPEGATASPDSAGAPVQPAAPTPDPVAPFAPIAPVAPPGPAVPAIPAAPEPTLAPLPYENPSWIRLTMIGPIVFVAGAVVIGLLVLAAALFRRAVDARQEEESFPIGKREASSPPIATNQSGGVAAALIVVGVIGATLFLLALGCAGLLWFRATPGPMPQLKAYPASNSPAPPPPPAISPERPLDLRAAPAPDSRMAPTPAKPLDGLDAP